jgi:tetratricopeptide (TPR) repeat protein
MAAPMTVSPSEEAYRQGLAFLERKAYKDAINSFRYAIDMERQEGTKNPRMKYVSCLGLAITYLNGRSDEGQKLCEQAVKREFFDPDLYCNLGIVYLRNRQKAKAFDAFQKGLNLKPGYARIQEELDRYERRTEPVFSFLPRTHPVNRLAGRLRYRLRLMFGGRTSTSEV